MLQDSLCNIDFNWTSPQGLHLLSNVHTIASLNDVTRCIKKTLSHRW